MNLKEFLREVRQTHDANIADTYVAKSDVDFTATDLADVFANAGASSPTQPQTGSNKLTPTLTLSDGNLSGSYGGYCQLYYNYNGDGQVFAHCNAAFTCVNSGMLGLYFEPDPYFAEERYTDNPVVVTLHATEGDNYAAATTTVTLGYYNPEG